jgi:hypothetical protein
MDSLPDSELGALRNRATANSTGRFGLIKVPINLGLLSKRGYFEQRGAPGLPTRWTAALGVIGCAGLVKLELISSTCAARRKSMLGASSGAIRFAVDQYRLARGVRDG